MSWAYPLSSRGGRSWASCSAFTLVELVVVIAIIAILAVLAIPSLSGLTRMSSEGAARTAFRSLFASARVRAATLQRYVGIRFQQDKDGRVYAIMLVPPDTAGEAPEAFPNGCPNYDEHCMYLTLVAAYDTEPVMLPRGVELAGGDFLAAQSNPDANPLWISDPASGDPTGCVPATTFTVVFSPSGQIVRRQVHVTQRRDHWSPNAGGQLVRVWQDPLFNLAGRGKFLPDVVDVAPSVAKPSPDPAADAKLDTDPDPQNETTGQSAGANQDLSDPPTRKDQALPRMSQTSIWVYEQQKRIDTGGAPFTGYIQQSGTLIPLNVYTGAPVNTRQ